MIEWSPIDTAPKDGRPVQAKIPGHGSDNIIAWISGLLNADGEDCGAWAFVEDQEPPDCWTDGICWDANDVGQSSIKPTHWKARS